MEDRSRKKDLWDVRSKLMRSLRESEDRQRSELQSGKPLQSVSRLKTRVKVRDFRQKSKLEFSIASCQWKTKGA